MCPSHASRAGASRTGMSSRLLTSLARETFFHSGVCLRGRSHAIILRQKKEVHRNVNCKETLRNEGRRFC
ncbi:hypothetical protein EVAR_78818_1 [Eumeta japonica]|uniref:Uncharacterized protein n=1 Tax=Eumeta variegata TaxID=151549 RepID=A0A4C1T516_EUMVA|nr:hypothetical protein EVAR_78818_1 [Eumeta japonica]